MAFGFRNKAEQGSQTPQGHAQAAAKSGSRQAARGARSARSGNIVAVTTPARPGRISRNRAV